MAIKGTATIHLTDVTTGQTQEIVHDNMVTNAVSDMCNTAGFFRAPITCAAFGANTIAEAMFGGLMLWTEPLNISSADDYYMPANNACVGYACQLANNTVNNMMGSFNESESGAIENGYRFVWDFETNQANGQIAAVSLVPRIAGQLGIGLSPDQIASIVDAGSPNFTTNVYGEGSYQFCRPYLFAADDILYGVAPYNLGYNASYANEHISRNGKRLILKRYHFPATKIRLSDNVGAFNGAYSDLEIQLPAELQISDTATTYYGFCNYDDGYIYLCIGTMNTGTVIDAQVCKISITDWSCSVVDVHAAFERSVTWCTVFLGAESWENAHAIMFKAQVRNNKIWITGKPATYIDLAAPISAHAVEYLDATNANITYLYASAGKYIYCINDAGRVCMINTASGSASMLNVTADNAVGITHTGGYYSGRYVYHIPYITGKQTIAMFDTSSYHDPNITCVALPHVLTTKNNLETPVVKTADTTMKITYIIREE